MKVRVKSGCLGYYGLRRRKGGEEFVLDSPAHFSKKWMESLEPAPVAEKQEVASEKTAEPELATKPTAKKPTAKPAESV